ncbi:putative enzyme [Hyella patelloides LEGE 07179]|uniref:Putative enzyme n=1 Tax=Hyella patelloides LEGE 07179 TaxID=945734 RepID=A0A563VMY3_9CYAN|nr:23S rRNA (uracil(1939)-C(5))-methyltransferase RlmD [Hyella patelloides]VEP12727.1 putative enzyme [Hyella patelloides LEGE 07179]
MKQGDLVTIKITDLNTSGEGVGRVDGKVIFVPDTVTGDCLQARITQVKAKYAKALPQNILVLSEHRIRPRCIVADKCGGCQWQHIDEAYQREAKQKQVIQALQRIGGFSELEVEPILHTGNSLNYRNKSTYPLKLSATGKVQAGYYRKASHKIINLNQCPVQDARLHPLLKEVKQDIHHQGWSIYDETTHQWQLRHLSLRIGTHTGEMLLTLVSTDDKLPNLEQQAEIWLQRYPNLVGVCLNLNSDRKNVIFGKETQTIAGKPDLKEIFAGIELRILSDTFFQVNTIAAEILLDVVIQKLNLQGNEVLVDAYCGIGTFTLPLAKLVKQAIGIESLTTSVAQAKHNAEINHINNVKFFLGKVATCLQQLDVNPDIVIVDPPRKGCNSQVLERLLEMQPSKIVYISCKPATLARDLKILVNSGVYKLSFVRSADFFPQTTHIESVAIIEKQ